MSDTSNEVVGLLIRVPYIKQAKAYYRDCLKFNITEDAPHYFSIVVEGPLKLAFWGSAEANNELSLYVRGTLSNRDGPTTFGATIRKIVDNNDIEIVIVS